MALRTVPWLTLYRLASSSSLGIGSPGPHSPDTRLWVIRSFICRYRGWNAGDGALVFIRALFLAQQHVQRPETDVFYKI
jgi:hypothetical protein